MRHMTLSNVRLTNKDVSMLNKLVLALLLSKLSFSISSIVTRISQSSERLTRLSRAYPEYNEQIILEFPIS